MTELLGDFAPILDLSAGGVVLLVVVMVLTGRLIPKQQHERELAVAAKQLDTLTELYRTEQSISVELSKQNAVLLPGTTLANHIAESLHQIADSRGQ